MQVWVSGDSDENIGKIASSIDHAIADAGPKKLKGFIIYIPKEGEDKKALAAKLQKLSDSNNLHDVAMLYISGPKDDALSDYKINTSADVKNTVFTYRRHRATANFVNLAGDAKGLAQLSDAIAKTVNGG